MKSEPSDVAATDVVAATCSCGHGVGHLMVSAEPKYSFMQWFWVICMGVSMRPLSLTYRCRVCRQVFASTTNPDTLTDYMGAG